MKLLDFPPEIFRRMIDCLVSDVGVVESWKLRGVCRTFDQEISENVLAIQPIEAFCTDPARRLFDCPEDMKYYLAYHVKNPRDVLLGLPTKIQEMVEYVTKELEAKEFHQDRNILLEVCAGVAWTCRDIHDLLWTSRPDRSSEHWFKTREEWRQKQSKSPRPGLNFEEKFIAAISVRAYWLVAELLHYPPVYLPQGVWERPISAAVRLEDSRTITLILDIPDKKKSKISKRSQMLDDTSAYSIVGGVSDSITYYDAEITNLLLGYLPGFTALLNKSLYGEWVKLVVDCQNNESLKCLLQVTAKERSYHVCNRTFEQGCRKENLAIVKTLLKYGQVQLDSSSTTLSALASSIRLGTVEMVREVVAAGADINYAMTAHQLGKRAIITPLEYAVYLRNLDVVAYLVECGANIPHQSYWPSRGGIRKVLQKAVKERAARRVR